MKTLSMILSQTLSSIFIGFVFLAVLFLIGYWLYLWGKRVKKQADEYDALYNEISENIIHFDRTKLNYDYIFDQIYKLISLKYKDNERSSALLNNFCREWNDIEREIVAEVRGKK